MNDIAISQLMWVGAKILVLLGLFIYLIFSAVIIRQEQLMANVLEESFEPILRTLAIIHFIVALVVTILAIVIL